ncbi:MAG: ASCH domain-containing protein [Methanoregula sp.]
MNVLLSVRPRYVDAIISGRKKFEFRKKIFKADDIDFVLIYASSPIRRIVGYFKLDDVIIDHPKNLWNNFSNHSGLEKTEFFEYFQEREIGYALHIKSFKKFPKPIDPKDIFQNFIPPQSFCYIHSTKRNLELK